MLFSPGGRQSAARTQEKSIRKAGMEEKQIHLLIFPHFLLS
jgi:hypothetical protein